MQIVDADETGISEWKHVGRRAQKGYKTRSHNMLKIGAKFENVMRITIRGLVRVNDDRCKTRLVVVFH